jgi:hypothetical protein
MQEPAETMTFQQWLDRGCETAKLHEIVTEHFTIEFDGSIQSCRDVFQTAEEWEEFANADINQVEECAQALNPCPGKFYVIQIEEDVTPIVHGPFKTEQDRQDFFDIMRSQNAMKDLPDGLYHAQIVDDKLEME